MYRALLAASLADAGVNENSDRQTAGELLASLLVARGRLVEGGRDSAGSAHERVTRELAYDVALVRLCRARGVAVDEGGFAQPVEQRYRLERMLEAQGIDVADLTAPIPPGEGG